MLAELFFRAGFLQVSSKLGIFDFFGVNLLVSPTARELCTSLELSSFSMFVFLLRLYVVFVRFCFSCQHYSSCVGMPLCQLLLGKL